MNDLRLWILTLTTVTFFAGVAGGVMVSNSQEIADVEELPHSDFERRFVQEFGLDAHRSEALRVILNYYHRDVQRIEQEHLAATYRDMEPELNDRGVFYAQLIRDKVLATSEDRARYDALAAGVPFRQTPSQPLNR